MAKKRTIVGSPLTPRLLKELGGIDRLPSTPASFRPDGNWVNSYRIWTCHGYIESNNHNVGFLRIRKKAGPAARTFELHIEQSILQTDAMVNTVETRMTCLNNEYASPVKWRLSSRFAGRTGAFLDDLGTTESVSIEGRLMTIETPEGILRREVDTPLTSDWSLFEAAQRWDAGEAHHLLVTMLEGLHALKPEQHISYRGPSQMLNGAGPGRLLCFAQLGVGILPTEYWLDTSHRLQVVTSMNKAYILDDRAEEVFARDLEQARKS
jgi:hypothetical protein